MIWLRRDLALALVVGLADRGLDRGCATAPSADAGAGAASVAHDLVRDDMSANALTLLRALAGFALTVPLGIALGALGALVPAFQRMMRPWSELLRPLPPAAIIPISVFAIGFGIKLYLFVIVFAAVWPVYINTVAAFAGTSDVLLRTGRAFGCNKAELIWSVVLPQALPQIFIGIRIAATVSLIGSVVTDLFAGQDGIGYLLFERAFALRVADVFALTVLCGLSGMISTDGAAVRRLTIGWHVRTMAEARHEAVAH